MRVAALMLAATLSIGAASEDKGPGGIAILDASQIKMILHQCSRSVPLAGEASWKPPARDIARLEAALPAALDKARTTWARELTGAPTGWIRQYVGIVRKGHRYIYGNFVPDQGFAEERRWRSEPVVICDGGAAFFGVEYDVNAGTFSHLDFNGGA